MTPPDAKTIATNAKRARALSKLSSAQRDLGSFDAALGPAQEAVDLYRSLTRTHPDPFLAELAGALTQLSLVQGDLGRHQAALVSGIEAMDTYRGLAKSNPEKYLPRFAMILMDVAVQLRHLGHHNEALPLAQGALEWLWPHYERSLDATHRPATGGAIHELPQQLAKMFSLVVTLHEDVGKRLDTIWAQRFEQVAARAAGEPKRNARSKSSSKKKALGERKKTPTSR